MHIDDGYCETDRVPYTYNLLFFTLFRIILIAVVYLEKKSSPNNNMCVNDSNVVRTYIRTLAMDVFSDINQMTVLPSG